MPPEVRTVRFDQVESAQDGRVVAKPVAEDVEDRKAVLVDHDGEAIVVDEHGLSVFQPLRYRTHDHAAVLCAFDLLELDGADFRSQPLEQRKAALAELLHKEAGGLRPTSLSCRN